MTEVAGQSDTSMSILKKTLKLRRGQRNMLVFALIARRLWKHFRLLKQRPHWCDSSRRRWISLPGTMWGCTGSLDILGYEEMKSPTSSQETVLFSGLLDMSHSWGVTRQNIRRKIKRWMENHHLVLWRGLCSTQKQAWELISGPNLATKPDYWPLTGHNPGLFLVSLLDITPWEDIYM
jgi:hypothetical protein